MTLTVKPKRAGSAWEVNIMMLNGYMAPADLFADTVAFEQSQRLISSSDTSAKAINL